MAARSLLFAMVALQIIPVTVRADEVGIIAFLPLVRGTEG